MSDPTVIASIWATLKSSFASLIAGILGAAVSLKFASPNLTNWEKVTTVSSGAILAHFMSHPVTSYFELHAYEEAVGFLIGLFGLSLCAAVIEAFRRLDLAAIIKNKLGA